MPSTASCIRRIPSNTPSMLSITSTFSSTPNMRPIPSTTYIVQNLSSPTTTRRMSSATVVSQATRWKISSVVSQPGAIQLHQIRQTRLHESVLTCLQSPKRHPQAASWLVKVAARKVREAEGMPTHSDCHKEGEETLRHVFPRHCRDKEWEVVDIVGVCLEYDPRSEIFGYEKRGSRNLKFMRPIGATWDVDSLSICDL